MLQPDIAAIAVPCPTTTERVPMEIRVDELTGREIIGLLHQHLENMKLHSPPESIHALDLVALRKPEITFWSVWQNAELMGCGAIKELDPRHGEIKSMRTVTAHLRKGVAARLLDHILAEARRRRYLRLSLETGSADAFAPARKLYAGFGFKPCRPFAPPRTSSLSRPPSSASKTF